ncbi:MAG: cupredoxin family copper-binding protein [Proteobacteria bacterium]|jgi:plastocyanin|nr:cupredoxin family copper-binding protein [Pseudomonadota bacterium]
MEGIRVIDGSRRRFLTAAASLAAVVGIMRAPRALAKPEVHTVVIDGFAFKPAELTVERGDTVVWRNTDPVPHTATAKDAFDSGSIAAGASWKYVATKPGRYDYLCTFHPIMKGTLVVR